jgi:hypothetical protein
MNYQKHVNELQQQLINQLSAITDRPDGWLPHMVFVEEECDDENGFGMPVYNPYRLVDFNADGSCTLRSFIDGEDDTERHLSEINIDWLVTVWNYDYELSGKRQEPETEPELKVFLFSIDMPRNISNAELIRLWNDNDSSVEVCTPNEFAARINDESFNDLENWVRFIKM